MAIVIDQMEAQVSEQPPDRPTPASAAPKPPEPDAILLLLRLANERRARLAAD